MSSAILHFMDNGIMREISSPVKMLRKENNNEFLYTWDGHKIRLEDLVSINGVSWS